MKDNTKNNLKMFISFIIMAFCFLVILRDTQYKGINIKNISLFILIMASVYFGMVFKGRKSSGKKEETKSEKTFSSTPDVPEEFRDEENRFQELNSEGMLR